MLRIEDIHTYYGDSYVLQGVSLRVAKGTIVALLGRNGMGKTTVIRTAIGFLYPKKGEIFFKDANVTHLVSYDRVRMGMGLVPQGRRIFKSLSVEDNLTVGAFKASGEWNLEKIYALFPRLKDRCRHPGNRLSGGEQQMLAISRALMGNPQFLLMDEPTEGLAPVLVQAVGDIIIRLRQEGFSILIVEQNMAFALEVADHVNILNRGRVVFSSSPQELMKNEEIKKRFLGI
jgi:branched-chain amino acid transport system ATP-binding protein